MGTIPCHTLYTKNQYKTQAVNTRNGEHCKQDGCYSNVPCPPPPKKERKKDADCSVLTLNTVELRYGSLSWAGEGEINIKINKVTHNGESRTGTASTR